MAAEHSGNGYIEDKKLIAKQFEGLEQSVGSLRTQSGEIMQSLTRLETRQEQMAVDISYLRKDSDCRREEIAEIKNTNAESKGRREIWLWLIGSGTVISLLLQLIFKS